MKLSFSKMNRFLFRNSNNLRRYMSNLPKESQPMENPTASPKYRPTEFQKFILVWTKKYKSKEEIPDFVSPDIIDRARSEVRIKISNLSILMTILACIGAIFLGKSAAKRGESVQKMNLDWHKQYEEDYLKKQGEAKK